MPTTKSAVDAAATKKKKTSKTKDVKEKKEKSSSSSKDKSEKKESTKKKKSATAEERDKDKAKPAKTPSDAAAPPATVQQPPSQPQPQQYDPDAVQLFRRYDRARTGVLLRSDFLQLLRDYAQPPQHALAHNQQQQHRSVRFLTPRQPLSLTDSQGIPLGYERSDKNSEFEAGQLFERYDKDHVGTLSLDKFHVFFNDFRTQLTGFVDDLSYASSHTTTAATSVGNGAESSLTTPPTITTTTSTDGDDSPRSKRRPQQTNAATAKTESSIRTSYQSALWELRKICKDELQQQRDRVLEAMDRLRMSRTSHSTRAMGASGSPRDTRWGDNQLMDRYDALESDSERLDEILRRTRRQLRKGTEVSSTEMETFLTLAPELLADARELAMKVYDNRNPDHDARDSQPLRRIAKEDKPLEVEDTIRDKTRSSSRSSPTTTTSTTTTGPLPSESVDTLQKTLRVKDQIIYQLLQERTTLRKQKNQAETDLHELTEMSTHEMRKWAQLTDDMQAEIARLRERLHEE